jgi:hypothetical protein
MIHNITKFSTHVILEEAFIPFYPLIFLPRKGFSRKKWCEINPLLLGKMEAIPQHEGTF